MYKTYIDISYQVIDTHEQGTDWPLGDAYTNSHKELSIDKKFKEYIKVKFIFDEKLWLFCFFICLSF